MKPSVYIETTIPSYLAAQTSADLVTVGHQVVTRDWWANRRQVFELYTSELVLEEAGRGDPGIARARLAYLESIPLLSLSEEARILARQFVERKALPATATVDALHIAVAAVSGMDFLVTWNCRHIANASIRPRIESLCRKARYEPPIICTPEELME
jgi:hypothetical protein